MLRRLACSSQQPAGFTARLASLGSTSKATLTRFYSGTPGLSPKTRADCDFDRDFFVSVLEASATKRDAKGYLQKYASTERSQRKHQKKLQESSRPLVTPQVSTKQHEPAVVVEPQTEQKPALDEDKLHLALVQIRLPQLMDERVKEGVAKTLSQLRTLGLLSIVVLDCGSSAKNKTSRAQCERLAYAVNKYRGPGAKVVENSLGLDNRLNKPDTSFSSEGVFVAFPRDIERTLEAGMIPILPALACEPSTYKTIETPAESILVALARYFSGLQFSPTDDLLGEAPGKKPLVSTIEKVIILDSNGGLPFSQGSRFSHRFVNLEQEYTGILGDLERALESKSPSAIVNGCDENISHIKNLKVLKNTLAILPDTSSALITTPLAAANISVLKQTAEQQQSVSNDSLPFGIAASVRTRRSLNPLIHNLLTDKPIYSSSLPFERISAPAVASPLEPAARMATLVKRGTPVRIYPDVSHGPWTPPKPGTVRPHLTDSHIDLPRLAYLIKDSFGRELDLDDYLARIKDNLAGVIIAGNYEGAAILTWEKPMGLTDEEAYTQNRFVPYLDKFAVLRSSQGVGGMADIVFNSMTRDCFPGGVCWRSRKNNPVNKWYFERSRGTMKLPESQWTIFWTTPGVEPGGAVVKDYEDACKKIKPSWLDMAKTE
ncbi:hypothetical protein TD95_001414 [Thielaviopsis punctulata]|uniref:Amino-acid acetyltransferase, mitochondrial n=1 Tax=Thielaviopsis punctulata TaxID=72032 RepID=A0A0F4Z743_9PEZI|nr:hypothetical protein TD95_001414 [Thielaviopsis punctulata]